MIKPNELRIGNIINVSECSGLHRHGTWRIANHRTISDIASGSSKNYEPTALTEEWLLKFGFEFSAELKVFGKTYQNPHYTNYSDWYIFKDEDNEFRIKFMRTDGFFDEMSVYFKYVHQLQNLYFTLTGEELTIKEAVS